MTTPRSVQRLYKSEMSSTNNLSEEELIAYKRKRAEQSRLSRLRKKNRAASKVDDGAPVSDNNIRHSNGLFLSITTRGIIERGLWSNYLYYIAHTSTQEEREAMVRDNTVINISERDAYLIGLLKVIYTDNVCHMFNRYLGTMLVNKSFTEKSGKQLIDRDVLLVAIDRFHNEFPPYYVPDAMWAAEIKKSMAYAMELKESLMGLRKHKDSNDDMMIVQDRICVAVASVKKLLVHNH